MSEYRGHENLEVMSAASNFNDWIYDEIVPMLHGDILEIGSGIGTFSKKIIHDFPDSKITLTDIDSLYVEKLGKFFSENKNVSSTSLDLNSVTDYEKIGYEKFDSIVAINVLEHVENDEFAIKQLYKMLKKGGSLAILVPCHKFLYNVIDSSIGHFRRYSKEELESKIKKTQFGIVDMFYFNMLGIVGWYINGNLSKKPTINDSAFKMYDKLVPILRVLERAINKKIGLSIICHLKK